MKMKFICIKTIYQDGYDSLEEFIEFEGNDELLINNRTVDFRKGMIYEGELEITGNYSFSANDGSWYGFNSETWKDYFKKC